MKVFSQLLCLALLCSLSLSCVDRKDEALPISKTTEEYQQILTSNHWKITKMEAVPAYLDPESGEIVSDLMSKFMENCEMDDLLIFRDNGTAAAETGIKKCDFQEEIEETGQWKFIFGNTKLQIIDLKGISKIYDIDEMTTTQIKLRSSAMLDKLSTAKIIFEAAE